MKHLYDNLIQEFKEWAKKKEMLPPHSDEMKEKLFQQLTVRSKVELQRPLRFSWIMVGVPAICLLLYIGFHFVPRDTHMTQVAYVGGGPDAPLGLYIPNDKPYYSPDEQELFGTQDFSSASNLGTRSTSGALDRTKNFILALGAELNPIDTREYMKTGYSATFFTRHVEKIGNRIQLLVRGHGGRINDVSLAPERGHVSFVIPKTSLALFRYEMQELAPGARFIFETENSRNALPQKQRIETDALNAEHSISQAQFDKERRTAEYTKKIALLQGEINRYAVTLAEIKSRIPTSTAHRDWLQKEITRVSAEQRLSVQRFEGEKKEFQQFIKTEDAIIASNEFFLKKLAKENDALMDSVDIVEGYISIEYVTVFQVVNFFIPVKIGLVLLATLIVGMYFFGVRQKSFEIP